MNYFNKFKFNQALIGKLDERRITKPTDIQDDVIPKILNNDDVIAQSETGTGKTLSYLLPLIHNMSKKKSPVLIISPTKELSKQIFDELVFYSGNLGIKSILLLSGEDIAKQQKHLKEGFDFIVGVTGRILKHVDNGVLKISMMKKIVLDEVDFLIELGFIEDLRRIFSFAKNCDQFLFFSATLSPKTKDIINELKNEKKLHKIESKNKLPENITNCFFPIGEKKREDVLLQIVENINPFLCLIFVRTKKESLWVYRILKDNKYLVNCLNGDLSTSQRKKAVDDFKNARTQYLIATDLASRGIDVAGINYIINFNLPLNELDYLHRAGRTGRQGDTGTIYTICNELDEGYLKKYSINLDFKLFPMKISNKGITEYAKYHGVKPRFNIEEKKKIERLKKINKKEKNDAGKKRVDKKRR
jgi:ATP-dependent RNA helicase DeaD